MTHTQQLTSEGKAGKTIWVIWPFPTALGLGAMPHLHIGITAFIPEMLHFLLAAPSAGCSQIFPMCWTLLPPRDRAHFSMSMYSLASRSISYLCAVLETTGVQKWLLPSRYAIYVQELKSYIILENVNQD